MRVMIRSNSPDITSKTTVMPVQTVSTMPVNRVVSRGEGQLTFRSSRAVSEKKPLAPRRDVGSATFAVGSFAIAVVIPGRVGGFAESRG